MESVEVAAKVEEPHSLPSGLSIRFVAFLLDWIVVVTGQRLVESLAWNYASIGPCSVMPLVGLLATGYFAVCQSERCGGQTIGMRLLRLRVVDYRGKELSLVRSAVRAAVLCPYWLGALAVVTPVAVGSLTAGLAVAIGVAMAVGSLAFGVLGRDSGRLPHDFLCGSYVVNAGTTGVVRGGALARVVPVLLILACAISIPAGVVAGRISAPLLSLLASVRSVEGVALRGVYVQKMVEPAGIVSLVRIDGLLLPGADGPRASKELASAAISYLGRHGVDGVTVVLEDDVTDWWLGRSSRFSLSAGATDTWLRGKPDVRRGESSWVLGFSSWHIQ